MKKQHARLENPMCLEFGIRNDKDLDEFIQEELPKFRLVSGEKTLDVLIVD